MANGNPKLAEVLARRGDPEEILGALVEGGILLVSDNEGSVLVGQLEDEGDVIAGFTHPEEYSGRTARTQFRHADAALLLEITRQGEVDALVVNPENENAMIVPVGDVRAFLAARGMTLDADTEVAFRPSEHEFVTPLQAGIAEALPRCPGVERVWISDVRMQSGLEGLMLHVVIAEDADPSVANELLQSAMRGLPDSDVPVFSHIADDEAERFLTEMNATVVRR
jgi:hypothetical protein